MMLESSSDLAAIPKKLNMPRGGERTGKFPDAARRVLGDGRPAWSKRWADLIYAHATDLGRPELLSEAQISIIRRASAMECALERQEGRMSMGEAVDIEVYARLASRLCRLLELIGIKRRVQPVDPLSELAKAVEGYAAAPIDDDGDEADEDEPLPIEEGFDKGEPGEA